MAWYPGQAGPGPASRSDPSELGDASSKRAKPDWKSRFVTPKSLFMSVGCTLLGMLAIVPIWNAVILLQDSNYVFWVGRRVPNAIILCCVLIIFVYAATVAVFFRKSQASVHTEQTMMMLASIFITSFGLFLMLASVPLTHQGELTYTNLLHRCDNSEQTHRLFEYSQVLQNIRATPACAKLYSVEDCAGYEEAAPFTNFLKGMEANFRCAGFCYHPPVAAAAGPSAPAPAAAAASPAPAEALISTRLRSRQVSLSTEVSTDKLTAAIEYPPTLFSDQNFQASCEGMAARDMKNFAGDIGQQTFYQGVYLVCIAVMTGFLKLMGFCVRGVSHSTQPLSRHDHHHHEKHHHEKHHHDHDEKNHHHKKHHHHHEKHHDHDGD